MADKVQVEHILAETIHCLKLGDHIATPGRLNLYQHHSIVVEVDVRRGTLMIVGYNWDDGGKVLASIQEDERGFDKTKVFIIKYLDAYTCFPREKVIQRARDHVGQTGFAGRRTGYHLLTNNCEHFSTWCKTGRAFCTQLPTEKEQINIATGAAVGAPVGALIGGLVANAVSSGDSKHETESEKKKAATVKAVGALVGGLLGVVVGGYIGSTVSVDPDTEDSDGEAGSKAIMGSIVPVEEATEDSDD